MVRSINAVVVVVTFGTHLGAVGFAEDPLPVPPAPAPSPEPGAALLAPPVSVGPYDMYSQPAPVAPIFVTPIYLAPVYVQPVIPAPVIVAADWYAPTYVEVHSSPWSYHAEYEYVTPYGVREVEYRVDPFGRVRVEYDD